MKGVNTVSNTFLWINFIATVVVIGYTAYLFTYLVKSRIEFIKLGKKAEFDNNVKERMNSIFVYVFGQKKLFKDKKSGIIHFLIFYGFLLVQLGAIDFIIKGLLPGKHLPLGPLYGYFTFFQEIVTLLILFAIMWAVYRRYIEKLPRLKRSFKNALVSIFISTLMITVLAGNGMWMIYSNMEASWHEPVASVIASIFQFLPETAALVVFFVMWWIHLLTLLTFLVYIPQGKHAHLIAGIANVYLHPIDYKPGKLKKIDFDAEGDEEVESFGVGKITDFTDLQMVDFYACVECGRCTNVCPAAGTGKLLSPMDLIMKMRDHLTNYGASVTARTPWVPTFAFKNTEGNQLAYAAGMAGAQESAATSVYTPQLIGDVITEEEIWACTTCRNCEDQCPVMNKHVDKIIDLRRFLVLTEGKMNSDAQRALTNIEKQGNPWGISKKDKEKFRELREDVTIPTVKELKKSGETFEYLLWVGSMGAFDNRSQKVALSFVRLLNEAGVKVAILGNKEMNSGDTPRRLGNEFLFQDFAQSNIEEFEKNGVKKIVTIDPHAFNTFKNEYPDFGLTAEVYHHTEVLHELVKDGRLKPRFAVNETITFHDSCYLGRYNEIYEQPREILRAIPGVKLVEMERNRTTAMCCGAGGGMMWTEEETGHRINIARTEQALEVNPTVISSGCPYCLTMLMDGTKAKEVENEVSTLDIAEILEKSVLGA